MDAAALGGVDPGGVDTGMAQNVRQPGKVFFDGIIRPGEKMAQIVGKDLARLHTGALAQGFHVPPDIRSVQWLARPGGEHRPGGLFLLSLIHI